MAPIGASETEQHVSPLLKTVVLSGSANAMVPTDCGQYFDPEP